MTNITIYASNDSGFICISKYQGMTRVESTDESDGEIDPGLREAVNLAIDKFEEAISWKE